MKELIGMAIIIFLVWLSNPEKPQQQ